MELSPITEAEFALLDVWSGVSDVAYQHFLRHNGYKTLDRFDEDALRGSLVEIASGEPAIDLSIVYGS